MSHARIVVAIVLSVACLSAGCNDGRPRRVPVTGQVLIDGEKLRSGSIRFTPNSGRPASGVIDQDGNFSLSTFEPGDGCPLGLHRVSVIAFDDLNSNTRRWNTPKGYATPETSGITQNIEGPASDVRIDLTWGSQKGPIIEKAYSE